VLSRSDSRFDASPSERRKRIAACFDASECVRADAIDTVSARARCVADGAYRLFEFAQIRAIRLVQREKKLARKISEAIRLSFGRCRRRVASSAARG
jgi:tRNA threonylcarbamoyladenosine modification (KEOPS) complex Cgi121 subunit